MKRSKGPHRLPYGGQIDRTRRIAFSFDGRTYQGHPGDTVSSALLANGVRIVARSFKFHRPRGVFSSGVEEPNALLQLGAGTRSVPSARAPMVELTEGLQARSQEGWPGVNFDVGRVLDFTSSLWAAGFYNKTFIWPRWHTYEGMIRRLAGLGRAPRQADPDRYDVENIHCDVLIVGAGVAGIRRALDAARDGARVVLAEEDPHLGGEAAWDGSTIDKVPASDWLRQATQQLVRHSHVRVLTRTSAVGYYDHDVVALLQGIESSQRDSARERFLIVRAKRVVLATGTIEQPLIFDHNDRPGILLAGAAREYLLRYGVAVGSRVLIATNNDSAYALARHLQEAGVTLAGVTDTRYSVSESLKAGLRSLGIDVFTRSIPTDTSGFSKLRSVTVARLSKDTQRVEALQTLRCDALAVSGGFSPALHLYAQAGGKLAYDETSGVLQPVTTHPSIELAGSAAQAVPVGPRVSPVGNTRRQWVDLLHDATVADLELALRENYTSIEHVKRYTTVGMAADQGKTSAAVTLGVVSRLRGIAAGALGHTTLRPPVTPVTLGAIAGRETGERFAPRRHLPMHDWHVARGAILQEFGGWQRPVAYPRADESREAAFLREARAVRTAAGLLDGSSLGKIEVHGPDAQDFLDRFYINNLKTLQPGRARYGLMLRETGILFDDGTVVALSPDHLLLTTTSGNAGRVFQWLEEWHQCEWPHLNVAITAITEQWATLSLAGPNARTILRRLGTDFNFAPDAFPHLALRQGRLLGLPARIYRVSFTGELTYEINVPADSGPKLWEALLEAGLGYGLEPIGLDALMLLRLEKGFLHVGTDTDGTTVPDDVGWGKVASGKTADFIGRRSLALAEHVRPDRLQLVGLTSVARADAQAAAKPFITGAHLRLPKSPNATDGWITSAGIAVVSGEPIALAMLRGGRAHFGTEINVYDAGVPVARAQVVSPPFFDPSGGRMNA
jgi:sarcosine oxidase, subunit alpha